MDYVPSHGDNTNLASREHISGARVFDGEDQGKWSQVMFGLDGNSGSFCLGYGNRYRMQQLQQEDWIKQQI